MSEWVLAPAKPTEPMLDAMADAYYLKGTDAAYPAMLSARPPIPPEVWEAMVERGAKALWTDGKYNGFEVGLRAALGIEE